MKRMLLGLLLGVCALVSAGGISSQLCTYSLGCLTSNGTYLFMDSDDDGTLDAGEVNLSINAPTGTSGNETVQGNLTVTGDLTDSGVTYAHERIVLGTYSTSTAPTSGQCIGLDTNSGPQTCAGAPLGHWRLPMKVKLTRFCVAVVGGNAYNGTSIIDLDNVTDAATLASISFSNSGGDVDGSGDAFCAAISSTTEGAGDRLQFTCRSGSCASTTWNETVFEVYGYGID